MITPVLYANQTAVSLGDPAVSITWKRKEGSGSEAALASGETVAGNVLTVTGNKLSGVASGLLTYIAYVSYTDPDNGLPINATADVSFALVKTGENARSAWIAGEQVFKYASGSSSASPAQITLTANLQNVTMGKWQYKTGAGEWADYPTTSDNATITAPTLIVKPDHAIWAGDSATLRITTSDPNVGDTTSIYKVSDGADGSAGAAGQSASIAFLSNENVTFAANAGGQVAATTVTCSVVAYTGTTKVTPTVGAVSGAPEGMTVTKGAAAGNEIPINIAIAANATLGGTGARQGALSVPVTSPVNTTLTIHWSKVNTGAAGAAGQSAVAVRAKRHGVRQRRGQPDHPDLGLFRLHAHRQRRNLCVGEVCQRQLDGDQRADRFQPDSGRLGGQGHGQLPMHHDLRRQDLSGHHHADRQDGQFPAGYRFHGGRYFQERRR